MVFDVCSFHTIWAQTLPCCIHVVCLKRVSTSFSWKPPGRNAHPTWKVMDMTKIWVKAPFFCCFLSSPLSPPLPPFLCRLEFISNQRASRELRLLITYSFAFLHINDCRLCCFSAAVPPPQPNPSHQQHSDIHHHIHCNTMSLLQPQGLSFQTFHYLSWHLEEDRGFQQIILPAVCFRSVVPNKWDFMFICIFLFKSLLMYLHQSVVLCA